MSGWEEFLEYIAGSTLIMENECVKEEVMNEDSSESEEISIKRIRLPRRQKTVQSNKKICAKDERNASIKKVSPT